MGDIDLLESYEQALQKGLALVNGETSLAQPFCTFVKAMESLPSQDFTVANRLFQDMNKEIDLYNQQYKILVKELGILCPSDPEGEAGKRFFSALLDLYRAALRPFHDSKDLQFFNSSLQEVVTLMETGKWTGKQEQSVSNALLILLKKSAYVLSKNKLSMTDQVKQLEMSGGKRKNKTRKQRKH